MFSRSSGLVFLALSLCALAVPSQNRHKPAAVVNRTSTAARAPPTVLAATSNNKSSGNNNNKASGNNNNKASGNNDLQTSLTLDPAVIAEGFANNGQNVTEAGQVPSLTSENNFINFCLTTPNVPITNGKQITTGSCNPAPMGSIPSTDNMPSAKFTQPLNMGTVKANQNFTISVALKGLETGNFVNAQENYFSAPQQLNTGGQVKGHSHVVVEQLQSLTQTTPLDPRKFSFFKGLNAVAQNGVLDVVVPGGLPPGFYKVSTINTAANHQPVLVPIAQHGSLDDVVYFTVTSDGATAGNGGQSNGGQSNSSAAPQASSTANPGKSKDRATAGNGRQSNGGQSNSSAAPQASSTAHAGNSKDRAKSSKVPSDATTSSATSTSGSESSVPCQ